MDRNVNVSEVVELLEEMASPMLQESYDNCGLLTGEGNMPLEGVLVSLDCTEQVVEEAIERKCNMIVSHHPPIFRGLKKLTGATYTERTIIKAIRNHIALYAIHTNLDNVRTGVNARISERLGLTNTRILLPRKGALRKLVTFVPEARLEALREALFTAGAGHIGNYDRCSFTSPGEGSFRGDASTQPFAGKPGEQHTEPEIRLEVIVPAVREKAVVESLLRTHPYEEPAYDIFELRNENSAEGAGMIGQLKEALSPPAFLAHLKACMQLRSIRYTASFRETIKTVAVCGGAGSFLLPYAMRASADAFITADFKYHEFFDAESRLMIADIGHYESEIFTKDLIRDIILRKFPTFAVLLSDTNTNPVNYF